jgi:hypothetical protein
VLRHVMKPTPVNPQNARVAEMRIAGKVDHAADMGIPIVMPRGALRYRVNCQCGRAD